MRNLVANRIFKWLTLLSGATLLGASNNCGVQIGDILVTTFAQTLSSVVGLFFQDIFANLFMTA
jgi:hypothetical protein